MVTPDGLPRLVCRRREAAEGWEKVEPVLLGENGIGGAPVLKTSLQTAWDDEGLHVLFQAEDTDAWATLTARDAPLYQEEVVELFLDPTGDLEGYFEIEVNPLNAVLDGVFRRTRSGYRKDFRWRCDGLRTAVSNTGGVWATEIFVPFDSLQPSCGGLGKIWRANFCRIDRPPNVPRELSAWSPTRCGTFHLPRRFGFLEFAR